MTIKPTLGLQYLDLDFLFYFYKNFRVGILFFQQKRLHIFLEHFAHTFGSVSSVMQTMRHMSKQVRNFIQKITKVDQDFYPEYLGKMFIVNAPTAFKAMWTVVRPWLDKATQKKIEVHSGNFTSKLLELVDSENLPAFLGGTCCCPGGCENADAGPWNETSYQNNQTFDEPPKAPY
jgi:hypothetical protein